MKIEIEGEAGYCFVQAPWKATGQIPIDWFESNFHRFVYSRDRIVANAVPYEFGDGPGNGGVYFLIENGEVVYAGMAKAIYSRLIQHVDSGKRFTHYWCFGGMPEHFVRDIESFYIHYLRPPLNLQYAPRDEFIVAMVRRALSGDLFGAGDESRTCELR